MTTQFKNDTVTASKVEPNDILVGYPHEFKVTSVEQEGRNVDIHAAFEGDDLILSLNSSRWVAIKRPVPALKPFPAGSVVHNGSVAYQRNGKGQWMYSTSYATSGDDLRAASVDDNYMREAVNKGWLTLLFEPKYD